MLGSGIREALLHWVGQVVALRFGAPQLECSCPACPSCPAHTLSCSCHGAPQPGALEASGQISGFLAGVLVGAVGVLAWRAARRVTPLEAARAAAEELDERERVQLELRRLRK